MGDIYSRTELKEKETLHLFEAYKKNPELFSRETFIESADVLKEFGIQIPDKESFPLGYLKLLPPDFIVEEIAKGGQVLNINYENVLSETTSVEPGPTLFATLVKCGLSTLDVVEELVKQSGCQETDIQYAGIKDKVAITSQRISLRNISLNSLKKVSSPHFFLKDVSGGKGVMEKGGLQGNRFTIFVRTEESFLEAEVSGAFVQRLQRLQTHGFYNFFYLQRFATPRLRNFYWGLDVLKGNHRNAILDFLTFQGQRELPYFRNLRAEIAKYFGNWEKVKELIAPFPLIFFFETRVVNYLLSRPTDFRGACSSISSQVSFWLKGLSSLLFNEKLSSYVLDGKEPPQTLPVFISLKREDIESYRDMLTNLGIYPPPFGNLKGQNFINFDTHGIKTKEKADIHRVEPVNGGVVFEFSLSKGEYATTLLAHLFNLVSDKPLETIFKEEIDLKSALGLTGSQETIKYFRSVIRSKDENYFDILKGE